MDHAKDGGSALLRIERGQATEEELAALTVTLYALLSRAAQPPAAPAGAQGASAAGPGGAGGGAAQGAGAGDGDCGAGTGGWGGAGYGPAGSGAYAAPLSWRWAADGQGR